MPRQSNESNPTDYGIWPNSNIVGNLKAIDTGIAVYPVIYRNLSVGGGGVVLYNTLVKITVTDVGPVCTRLVPQLFYVNCLVT